MLNLAGGLVDRGIEVDLVLAQAQGEFLTEISSKVRVIDLGASRVLASLPGLVGYLRKAKPKVLLSALEHANLVATLARFISCVSTDVVLSVHAPLSLSLGRPGTLIEKVMPRLVRMTYSRAGTVVCVSQGVGRDLISNFGVRESKVRTIYNPIVNARLYDMGRHELSHAWFEPRQPPVLLAVGRLSVEKDYATLIRAFHKVRQRRPSRLMILGEGGERQNLEKLVRDLGLIDDVQMPGFVRNPYSIMSRASCFVLSSHFEGFGNVIVEALAMGCPVVSTDCPTGPAEILEGGKWGALVPVGDHEIMASAILARLENPRSGSSPQLAKYLSRFGIDDVISRYMDIFYPSTTAELALNQKYDDRAT